MSNASNMLRYFRNRDALIASVTILKQDKHRDYYNLIDEQLIILIIFLAFIQDLKIHSCDSVRRHSQE